MPRIGLLIQSVDARAGGTSTAFLNTCRALSTFAPSIDLRLFSAEPPHADPAWSVINLVGPRRWTFADADGRLTRPGSLGRTVIKAIDAREIDALHIHGVWSPDLLAAARAARRAGIPYLWQPHGMLLREALAQKSLKKKLFIALGLGSALAHASRFLFCLADERDHSPLPSRVPAAHRLVVPLPVELPADLGDLTAFRARARARFNLAADAPVLVFMGRLHPVKRIELTLRAAAIASRSLPGLRLLLLGSGDEPYVASLRALAAELNIANHVIFAGWLSGPDKWLGLAAGDALILNSVHENFGFTAVEAPLVGTPPILTSNLSIAPEVRAAAAGIVCEPNPDSLAVAIATLLVNPARADLAARSAAWVRGYLSEQAVAQRLADIYHHVTAP